MSKTKLKDMSENIEENEVIEASVIEETPAAVEVASDASEEVKVEVTEVTAEAAPKKVKADTKKADPKPKHSKKYLAAAEKIDKLATYKIAEAIELAKAGHYAKFPGSLEVHINTRVKNLRGLVTLPHLSGKQLNILAFGDKAAESGANMVGDDKKLDEIMKGKIDFDVMVVTPAWMPKLARAAKVLGPKGLMPNPKNGTVTDNLEKAVNELKAGKVEYRTENNLMTMHLGIGGLTQPSEELELNLKTLFAAIGKTKVKKMTLAPTMGPAVRVDLSSL